MITWVIQAVETNTKFLVALKNIILCLTLVLINESVSNGLVAFPEVVIQGPSPVLCLHYHHPRKHRGLFLFPVIQPEMREETEDGKGTYFLTTSANKLCVPDSISERESHVPTEV